MHIRILTVLILVSQALAVIAQNNNKKFEMGAGLAGFVYQGDLTPNPAGSFRTTRPGLVLSGAKILSSSFQLRANVSIGGLKGDETKYQNPEYRKFRAFTFHTPVFEISPQLLWNPFRKNYADKGFAPYFLGGIGLSFFNIKRDWSGFDAEYFGDGSDIPARLALDEQDEPPKTKIVVPVGAGLRYNFSGRLAINVEEIYRFPFTDYLDGFSNAANPERKDHYHSMMIGLIYRIGGKSTLNCPAVKF